MIWHNKHQVFNQIEEVSVFWKNQIFSDLPNQMFRFSADAQRNNPFC
jgi:hypothetical protein